MAANTSPIAINVLNNAFLKMTTQAGTQTSRDGTGATATGWAAGANGGRVMLIRAMPLGTNVASALIIYLNNGSTLGTATNNTLINEVQLLATTASNTTGQTPVDTVIDRGVPTLWTVAVQLGVTVAAGWQITVFGGNY